MVWDRTEGCGADMVIEAAGRISAFDEGMSLFADHGRSLAAISCSGSTPVVGALRSTR